MKKIPALCVRIVAREVKRCRLKVVALDDEDVRQELLYVACRAYEKHDGRESWSYVYQAVRNRIKNMHARAFCARSYPQDEYGRPHAQFLTPDVLVLPTRESDAETRLEAKRTVALIMRCCGRSERRKIAEALQGDGSLDDDVLARVRRRMMQGRSDELDDVVIAKVRRRIMLSGIPVAEATNP